MSRLLRRFRAAIAAVAGIAGIATTLLCAYTHAAPSAVPPAPTPTKPSAITTGRPEPVPIVFVYRDSVADSAWTLSHELARKAVEAEFGTRVSTIAVERVATASDADRVFRDLVTRGYKVIFATDPVHNDAAAKVAAADYDIKIEQAVSGQTLINTRVYEIRHFEQAYLAGIIAAGNSRSGKLGFIAAYASPATLAEINAFALGAQSVNKRISTQVVWVGSRSNPGADSTAAKTLINRGADVLIATTDSRAVAQVTERHRKRKIGLIGWHADQSALAPRAHIASLALDWAPFYKAAVRESFAYMCTKTDTSRGYRDGAIKIVGLSKALSRVAKARLESVQTQLGRGEFQVFKGPLRSNSNTEMLADKTVADAAWRKSMNVLVRGVVVVASANAHSGGSRGRD